MSGKHERAARRWEQFTRWCERKAENARQPDKQKLYGEAAQWGEMNAQTKRRDAKRGSRHA